jgi:raffinose/stachyose/melibiose transport system permease protein
MSKLVKSKMKSRYPYALIIPIALIYSVFFILPTVISLFFSMTRWSLFDWQFVGLDNFKQYFQEASLAIGFKNTLFYATITCSLKVIFGLCLALLLTGPIRARGYLRSVVFFPVLVSTVGVGYTFGVLLDPYHGPINSTIVNLAKHIGVTTFGPGWLTDPNMLPLFSVALVDVWKGVGMATVIYMAGLAAIPQEYYEAAAVDGASSWHRFKNITLPLVFPATASVIMLSFIGGLRYFDLIWAMTNGGPGFLSDVIASINYKQYQAGFYGLATAGNVILLIFVLILVLPLYRYINKRQAELNS